MNATTIDLFKRGTQWEWRMIVGAAILTSLKSFATARIAVRHARRYATQRLHPDVSLDGVKAFIDGCPGRAVSRKELFRLR